MDTLILDGSHRSGGNTGVLLGVLRDAMEERGFSCATLALRDLHIRHCRVCGICNSHPRCRVDPVVKKGFYTYDLYEWDVLISSAGAVS